MSLVSSSSLSFQAKKYIDHFNQRLNTSLPEETLSRVSKIVERNNMLSWLLDNPEYESCMKKQNDLIKDAKLALVFCIDGRIPAIFLGGWFADSWETPAGEIIAKMRQSDGTIIPFATHLGESLRRLVDNKQDLLEIVLGHTSLSSSHGCGAMAAKKKAGLIDENKSLEEANLEIINQKSIPALTNLYNEFRKQANLAPLAQAGVSAMYDTDTFGFIFNFENKQTSKKLSTTALTNEFSTLISGSLTDSPLSFGVYHSSFTRLDRFIQFSKDIIKITEVLLESSDLKHLRDQVTNFINKTYPKLTSNQKSALRFFILRTIAFQYLTGLCVFKKHPRHPFVEHSETYIATSTRGKTIGKLDPAEQGFGSNAEDSSTAVSNIKVKLAIMNESLAEGHALQKPYLLFICNPVNKIDLSENNETIHAVLGSNAGLFRDITADSELWELIKSGQLFPIPVLVDEDTREVLKIIDHSAYL